MRSLLATASHPGKIATSVRVAVVVGTALSLLNHAEAFFGGGSIPWLRVGLNFFVPFCVATYGAVQGERRREGSRRA